MNSRPSYNPLTPPPQSFSIDAAAIQAEMAKKYGIPMPGISTNPGGRGSRRNAQKTKCNQGGSNSNEPLPILCVSCGHKNTLPVNDGSSSSKRIEHCGNCGYFFPVASQTVSSLAQRRGLMLPYGQTAIPQKSEKEVMKPLEWYVLEGHLQRKVDPDCCCPICMEKFVSGEEVLLSCGHIFHKVCLRSFENFMKTSDLVCPLCRTKNYQKKLTNLGTIGHQKHCAKRIQALYRGYIARKQFKLSLRRFYRSGKGDESRRKRFFDQEFCLMSRKIDQSVDTRANQVNSLIRSMEQTLDQSRQLDMLFEQMLQNRLNGGQADPPTLDVPSSSHVGIVMDKEKNCHLSGIPAFDPLEVCIESNGPWKDVLDQAILRGACDCAICMIPMTTTFEYNIFDSQHSSLMQHHNQKKSVLLSCTHLFHEACLTSFERFSRSEKISCPICRSTYSKRILST